MRSFRGTTIGVVLAATVLWSSGAYAASASDAWITTKAKMALLTTEGVSGTAVHVDTLDGRVTLHGTVGSAAEKARAEQAVKAIEGVAGVRSLLQVVPAGHERAASASDADVRGRVAKALEAAPDLRGVEVKSVNDGVVLLGGRVPTLSDHLRAVEVASGVEGVRRVASEIQSPNKLGDAEIYTERRAADAGGGAGGMIRDMWITSAVKMRLLADERTPALDVNVDTTGGRVTLFGMVPTQAAKAAAEEDARKVDGVAAVANDLQVVAEQRQEAVQAKDDEVEQRVKASLRGKDALKGVQVEVENGVVRLTGTVPTQEQRLYAAVAARTARGARAVRDDLRVEQ